MTKWLIYLGVLIVLIAITLISITASKAGFLIVEDCRYEYTPCSIEEKFTRTFHGHPEPLKRFAVTDETLPEGLVWQDGSEQEPFADPHAKKGGTWNSFISTYPQTLRQIGVNANTSFRQYLDANDMGLVDVHPATEAFFPSLAKEWAIGPDKRTVYFRLDPAARWSDGIPITADDYVCMLKLFRSPGIVDPWTNTYATDQMEDVLKFDDYTIAVRFPRRQPNLVYSAALAPMPYHFYGNFRTKEHEFSGKTAYYTLKNNKLPIPDELKYYQIQEHLEALEAFVVSLKNRLDGPDAPAPELGGSVDPQALLKEVMDARAAAAQLFDALADGRTPTDAEIEQIKAITAGFARQTAQLDSIKPTPEQAKKPYAITVTDVLDGWNKNFNWRAKPNTGPYQVEQYMHGKWVLFKRNANWWAENHKFYKYRYNPEYMRYRLIPKAEIAFEYFKQGELDAFSLKLAEYWYKKASDLSQYEKGYIHKSWFWNDIPRPSRLISMNLETEILKDKNIRLGIAHALNIQKMIDLAMLGDASQADTITTGYRGFGNTDLKARAYDVEKATGYLAQAGWTRIGADGIRIKDGQRLSVKLLYFYPSEKEYIMILKEEAAKAGIEIKPDTYDATTAFKFVQDKKHEMVWHGWSPWSNLRGPTYFGSYHGKDAGLPNNNNFCNFSDPEVDRLLETYRNSNNRPERQKLAKEIQAKVYDACCAIPTYYIPFSRYATWRWVRVPDAAELPTSETIFDYGLHWIDEEMKQETLKAMKTGKTFPRTFRVYDQYRPESAKQNR
jgi:ABC-type transport system substrate-binding protein